MNRIGEERTRGNYITIIIHKQDRVTRDWYRHNIQTNATALIINVTELATAIPGYSSITFSPDGNYLLVAYNVSAISSCLFSLLLTPLYF